MERAEKYGLGVAAAGHALLFGLLSVGFLSTPNPLKLESKPIDISLVDEVALEAAAPAATEAPDTSMAPDTGPPEDAPPPAEAVAPPEPAPPVARPEPAPAAPPKPAPVAKPQPPKPAPKAATPPAKTVQPKAAPKAASAVAKAAGTNTAATRPRPRGSLLGDDFRKSLAVSQERGTAQAPRASQVSAQAVAGLGDAIARQVQPCANRIPNPGPGANMIRSKLRIRMNPDGTLAGRPQVTGQTGITGENGRYAQRVGELAAAAVIQCAPYELPDELYKGGWEDIIINYRLPG